MTDSKNTTPILRELEGFLARTESTEQFSPLDQLLSSANRALTRIEALRWGERPKEGESPEDLALCLAADAVRILSEFRENDLVDPNW